MEAIMLACFYNTLSAWIINRYDKKAFGIISILLLYIFSASLGFASIDNPTPQERSKIAIIYPDLDEPFRGIFAKIIEGIEGKLKGKVVHFPLLNNTSTSDLGYQLKRNGIQVAIVLGKPAVKAAMSFDKDITVIAGGILSISESERRNIIGVSFTPDPDLLFENLKFILPEIKKITVLYDPKYNGWLMEAAYEAAKKNGVELAAIESTNLGVAARYYTSTLSTIEGRKEAFWLPQDPTTVNETTLLPLILKEAWEHHIPLVSSNLAHIKKGVLLAIYPDNIWLGSTLAKMALKVLAGEKYKSGLLPLRDLQTAINLRTAVHLGVNPEFSQRHFNTVFPER